MLDGSNCWSACGASFRMTGFFWSDQWCFTPFQDCRCKTQVIKDVKTHKISSDSRVET